MEHGTEAVTRLVFQLAVILIAAKLSGEIFERFLKMPSVLGELGAGIIIGPFALGGVDFPAIGALFGHLSDGEGFEIPISEPLWAIAQIGSIVLLFVAGLETHLGQFLKYARPASIVAIGGVILPFLLGDILTVAFGFADSITDLQALFVGAVLTATSIGITVRVLDDIGQLDSPEGVTVLGAAVLDDVIGILILTIVVGLNTTGDLSATSIGIVAVKTFGFWIALTGIGILLSKKISSMLQWFNVDGAAVGLAFAVALFAAGLAESFGLAMIIGSFSIGLALSGTPLAHELEKPMKAVYFALVPVFFVVMGMMVDLSALGSVWMFGIVVTVLALIGKIVGSGLPALMLGFNRKGALRIGVGMSPRGEVALIMAGIGISSGVLGQDLYGVSILMAVLTTAAAPAMLAFLFRDNSSGRRTEEPTQP